jgi:hypothetical protein
MLRNLNLLFLTFPMYIKKKKMAEDRIHCVDGCGPLSAEQRKPLEQLLQSAPDVVAINVHPTLETKGDNSIGMVLYMKPEAVVDATLISDRLWESLAVSKVRTGNKGAKPVDEHFIGKNAALQDFIALNPGNRSADNMRDPKTNADMRPWSAELGGPGSFAGAFYVPVGEDHRNKEYYVAVRSCVPQLVADLKKAINTQAPTYRDLVVSDEWSKRMHYGTYVSERNAQRNLVGVAAACQVSINRMDDIGSKLPSPDHAPPERAVPDYQQQTHSIQSTMYKGKPAVALYYGVIPAAETKHEKIAYVAANPQHGIYAFPIAEQSSFASSLPAALPSTHKNAAVAKPALKAAGWNPEHAFGLMVPLSLFEA